jgi:quercetin dioxygenase-like cupin family protein
MRRSLAVAVLAVALGGVAAGTANATPASGVSAITYRLGSTAVQVVKIAPGGTTGWHTHPGPTTVFVLQGTGTLYHSNCMSTVYSAGSTFTQFPTEVHVFRNEGTIPLLVVATYFSLPPGAPIRIDQPNPGCPVS